MQIIYTELKNTLEYTCDVNVFNVSMIMRVSYNSRSKKRLISLTSLDGSILYLKPTYITYGSRIFPNFNAIIDGLSFYITLDRLTLTGDNYLNWANQFRLCFVEYIPFEKGEGWYLAENSLEENALTPNFGEWVIKADGISISGDNILYQASKTNSILTYDSFTTFSLETALVRSLHDSDMQQWQAVIGAIVGLTGATEWTFDNTNNVVRHAVINPDINVVASTLTNRHSRSPSDFVGVDAFTALMEGAVDYVIDPENNTIQKPNPDSSSFCASFESCAFAHDLWRTSDIDSGLHTDAMSACNAAISVANSKNNGYRYSFRGLTSSYCNVTMTRNNQNSNGGFPIYKYTNPSFNPAVNEPPKTVPASPQDIEDAIKKALEENNSSQADAIADAITAAYTYDVIGFNELYDSLSTTYQQVAQQIISNAELGGNEVLQMLSQDYINLVANSILNSDKSKQFVKISDLVDQFEENKTLRI